MQMTTVTLKGQVTIPQRIRDKLGISPSDKVIFEEKGNQVIVKKAPDIKKYEAFLSKASSPEDERKAMTEAVIKHALGKD